MRPPLTGRGQCPSTCRGPAGAPRARCLRPALSVVDWTPIGTRSAAGAACAELQRACRGRDCRSCLRPAGPRGPACPSV
eukprot:6679507-Alexandrium_andersonii.AAC.1